MFAILSQGNVNGTVRFILDSPPSCFVPKEFLVPHKFLLFNVNIKVTFFFVLSSLLPELNEKFPNLKLVLIWFRFFLVLGNCFLPANWKGKEKLFSNCLHKAFEFQFNPLVSYFLGYLFNRGTGWKFNFVTPIFFYIFLFTETWLETLCVGK